MLIEYESRAIMELLTDSNFLKREVGINVSRQLLKRLNEIRASNNFSIFLSTRLGSPHRLVGDLAGYFGVNITANYRLILKPKTQRLEAEALKVCDTIIIKGVIDYHGKNNKWLIP